MLRAVVPVVLALLALLPTVALAAAPAAPALVRDLDPRPFDTVAGSNLPGQFFRAGPRTVFVRQDSSLLDTGELWSTDGTAAGTERLRAFPSHLRILGSTGSVVLFATPALVNSAYTEPSRLWRTDGTREGTFALGTLLGADLTSTDPMQSPALVFRNVLLFSGCTPAGGCELWRSDGTPEGTRRLREIVPGPGGSAPYAFTAFAGRAWFFAEDAHGTGLWQTDGTSRGTQGVLGLPPFASPRHIFVQGTRLYFTEGVGDLGYAEGAYLWTSDGTAAGTHRVLPFAPTHDGGGPQVISLASGLGDRAVFVGVRGRGDFELWITDPDARSSHPLTHVAPLPHGGFLPFESAAETGGRLVFTISGRLWTSRGTFADTRPLDGCPQGCPAQATIWGALPAASGRVLFAGGSTASPSSLWTTDGTGAGTRKVADLCTGSCTGAPQLAGILLGKAYFYFDDRLWVTDGTAAGTLALADHPVTSSGFYTPPPIFAAGDRVFFPIVSATAGAELWSTDGTPAGTAFLAGQEDGASSLPQGFSPFKDGVLFFTCIANQGEPWYSDGTRDGTLALPGITTCQGWQGDDTPPPVLRLGDDAFFIASSEDFVRGLWRTDGTPAGTFPLFVPGADEFLGDATVFRGKLFFTTATDTETRFWASDGTAAGTARLYSLPLSYVFGLTPVGDRLLFRGDDTSQQTHLWVTDGTAAGTDIFADSDALPPPFLPFAGAFYSLSSDSLMRTDLTSAGTRTVLPNDASPDPLFNFRGLVPFAGALFFIAQSGFQYEELPHPFSLYRSDGTAVGTLPVQELGEEIDFPSTTPPAVAGGLLYFVAGDAEHGQELWRSDGTAAGTFRVADLQPGAASSMPAELTAAGDRLFFTADDGVHGRELWVTRGVAGDPQPVGRRTDGTLSLSPAGLTVAGDTLFFSADDGVTGRELWSLSLAPTPPDNP
jgi:ELWxxDGT repeat protein